MKKPPGWTRLLLVACLIACLAGCAPHRTGDSRPMVLVSIPPQAYFVKRLAGNLVAVDVMIPAGSNPETHEPTMKQMKLASRARLYLSIDHPRFPFERVWLKRLTAGNPALRVVPVSRGIAVDPDDPHLWVSPANGLIIASNTAAALEELLPSRRADIQANLKRLERDIKSLQSQVKRLLAPLRGATIYTYHPAWGYLTREYGLHQVAIEQGDREPSAAELSHLVRAARLSKARVIFAEPEFSHQSVDELARELHARVVLVDPLAPDWLGNTLRVAQAFARGVAR